MQPSHPSTNRPDPSRALKVKTPPPAFINLDNCKPILSTTTTNTSTNSSANGRTAFVFTSSRTLRALQDQEDNGHRYSPHSPATSSPSSPATPSSECSLSDGRARASLTLSQVARHSEGAMNARSLLGPKMRAAGFVNLPNTLGSRSDLSFPSTPSSPSVYSSVSGYVLPTPSDPPIFPPIVFVNPTAVTTTSMWEYQRSMNWNLLSQDHGRQAGVRSSRTSSPASTGSSEFTPVAPAASSSSPPVLHPPRRPGLQQGSRSSGSDSSGIFSSTSSSTLLSGSSTSLSSVDETDEGVALERSRSNKGKARAQEVEPTEFPFPASCDSPRSQGSCRSHGSRASSATVSPTVVAAPPTAHPSPLLLIPSSSSSSRRQGGQPDKPPSPNRPRRSSDEKREKAKAKAKAKQQQAAFEPTPTFATAKRPNYKRQYSLTELCDSSPFVWMTNSEMFAPPAPIARSPVRTSANSMMSSPAVSRPRPPIDPPDPPSTPYRHRRHHTTADGGRAQPPDPSSRVHRIVSAPIRMPTIRSEPGSSSDRESDQAWTPTRTTKGRDRGQTDRRVAGNDPSRALLPAVDIHDPRSGDNVSTGRGPEPGGVASAARGRGRDTRGKVLGASETAEERATAQAQAEMDREKARALEELAALTLAHAEGDYEFAHHVTAERERNKVLKQRQRVHHKLRGKALQDECQSESEVTMVDQDGLAVTTVP
ncbi:hypothetical protein C8Q76DRAFT_837674 [Earliella scabrosa]|nr:hypothetical protein C8Q76DRAFT_837674 [Earliella scabrosa]